MNLSVNFPYKLESRKGEIIIKDTVTICFCFHLAIYLAECVERDVVASVGLWEASC